MTRCEEARNVSAFSQNAASCRQRQETSYSSESSRMMGSACCSIPQTLSRFARSDSLSPSDSIFPQKPYHGCRRKSQPPEGRLSAYSVRSMLISSSSLHPFSSSPGISQSASGTFPRPWYCSYSSYRLFSITGRLSQIVCSKSSFRNTSFSCSSALPAFGAAAADFPASPQSASFSFAPRRRHSSAAAARALTHPPQSLL